LEHDGCVQAMRSVAGTAELGAHLHGEFVEPEKRFRGRSYDGAYTAELQRDYPRALEPAKLETLTALFRGRMGRSPASFRAGRFGVGSSTFGILLDLGYRVDSSITPGVLWRYEVGDVDFRSAPTRWFFADRERFLAPGSSALLEVPVTIHPVHGW